MLSTQGIEPVHTAADVHALLAAAGAVWTKQTVAKALFKMVKDGTLVRKYGRLILLN